MMLIMGLCVFTLIAIVLVCADSAEKPKNTLPAKPEQPKAKRQSSTYIDAQFKR